MTATFYVGDAIEVMGKLPEKSVDLILTSPPFLALRSYLPADHPDKALEGGSQATPGIYIDWLIDVVEACDRVLAPHGSMCIELGDTYSGSSGDNWHKSADKIHAYNGPDSAPTVADWTAWPLAKSLSLIPELFRLTLVYGTNPLTGRQTERWRLRNVVRWVRPNPPVGALGDKFRPATSELMVFCKSAKRYFDLDAVREPPKEHTQTSWNIVNSKLATNPKRGEQSGDVHHAYHPAGAPPLDWWKIADTPHELTIVKEDGEWPAWAYVAAGSGWNASAAPSQQAQYVLDALADAAKTLHETQGAPPLDWWNIPPGGYEGAHYAVFPPELCIKPIKAMCPERVCRQCGQPSVRETEGAGWRQAELAAHIKERREALGLTSKDINGWFGYDEIAKNWERTDAYGARVPNFTDWPILKTRLGLADEFDAVIRQLNGIEYLTEDGQALAPSERRTAYDRGGLPPSDTNRIKASRKASDRFTDCGHDDWRPGLVLDPFGGSGTTALVATGHGRDCILIDLDERNYELALQRVGPFILERAV